MTRPVRFLISALVVIAASAATLLVLEFAVRWAIPAFDPSGHVRIVKGSGEIPNLGKPNTRLRQIKNTGDFNVEVRFNKYGFRDDRDLAQSSLDDFFVVGDSISFGWGVEETDRVSEQLEKITGLRMFNISIPGNLDEMEKLINWAEKHGAKIGNLIIFFGTEVRLQNYDAPPVPPGSRSRSTYQWFRILKAQLMSKSALYFLFTSFVHRSPALKNMAIEAGLIDPNLAGFPIHTFNSQAIESTARRLARFAQRNYRRLVIVVLPQRTLWVGPSQKTEDKIWKALVGRLRELNLDVVDMRPYFEAGGNPFQYFFKNDGHWNPAGHALAGRAVARHLGFGTGNK